MNSGIAIGGSISLHLKRRCFEADGNLAIQFATEIVFRDELSGPSGFTTDLGFRSMSDSENSAHFAIP